MQLPLFVEEITPEWLTVALQPHLNGVGIVSATVDKIIWGTGCKVLMKVVYSGDTDPYGPPDTLCIKGGFDAKQHEHAALVAAYRREAEFHAHLAPSLDMPSLPCWFAGANEKQGIIILSDARPLAVKFNDCRQTLSVDLVANGLEALASLHAATRNANFDRFPWLNSISPVRENAKIMLVEPAWEEHFASGHAPPIPEEFQNFGRIRAAFEKSWLVEDATIPSVVHNDSHVGNTAIMGDGKISFIDWQCVCIGSGIDDVAYFIGGALTIADRRGNEKALLQHYLDALAAKGGPGFDFDKAWLDYRKLQMHGFWWALTLPTMQPFDVVTAMTERHVAAMQDIETLAALGV